MKKKKKPDKSSNIKTKIGLGIGIVAISGIMVFFVTSNGLISEQENNESSLDIDLEQQAIEIVQSYRGKDGQGENLLERFKTAFDAVYSGEDIFLNPSTKISWSATKDIFSSDVYQVQFNIETTQEKSIFRYYVNLQTKEVWTKELGAQRMLNKLN